MQFRTYDSGLDDAEAFVAVIRQGAHLAAFAFGHTLDEANAKAEAFISAEAAKAAKRTGAPKKAKAEPPAEPVAPVTTGRRRQHHTPPPATDTVEEAI